MIVRVDKLTFWYMPDNLSIRSSFVPVDFLIILKRYRPAIIGKGVAFHLLVAVV